MRQLVLGVVLLAAGMLAGLAYALLVVPESGGAADSVSAPALQAIARSNARFEEKFTEEMEALRREIRGLDPSARVPGDRSAGPRARARTQHDGTGGSPSSGESTAAVLAEARSGASSAGDPSGTVSSLLRALDGTTDAAARLAVVQRLAALGRSASDAAPQLAALARGDSVLGLEAASAICRVRPRDCAAALEVMLATAADERHPLRASAIDAIAAAGPRARVAVPVLVTAMGQDATRISAARAVCLVGGPEAVRAQAELTRLAKEGGAGAPAAIGALGDLGAQGRTAVPALIETMRSTEPAVRAASARSLGRIGAEAAVPALTSACSDPEPRVREAAEDALVAVVRGR